MKTLGLINFLILAACGGSPLMDTGGNEASATSMKMAPADAQESAQAPSESAQASKKIIKNGGINFQSKDVTVDYQAILEMLPAFDAYIENENQSKEYDQLVNTLTVRVPAEKYDSLFNSIVGIAYRLESKWSNIQDVTAQFYDLQQRITNKKALEARYLDLLRQTSNIKDILEIERSLNEIRTEIESMEGQFKYLNAQISLSTINLRFYEILPIADDGSPRKGFGARLLSALNGGWQGFLSFLVGLVTLWPFVLLSFAGIYLFKQARKRWGKKA